MSPWPQMFFIVKRRPYSQARDVGGLRPHSSCAIWRTGQARSERSFPQSAPIGWRSRYPRCREHHLNTVKQGAEVQNENWVNSIARKRPTKALCPLLSIESHFGKLDIAGSRPVSRAVPSGAKRIVDAQPSPATTFWGQSQGFHPRIAVATTSASARLLARCTCLRPSARTLLLNAFIATALSALPPRRCPA